MTTPETDPILDAIQRFRAEEKWLWTLITDPTGSRYFEVKSKATRLQEFKEQIERMALFLDFVGNPEGQYSSIHVAGTSGKGSVVYLLAEMLSSAGQRVGYHVSPYLQVCNEKLIVDRQLIPPSEFVTLVEELRADYGRWQAAGGKYATIKYGEAWVALTFIWMAKQKVDWAVIETGLGGRYDPTNVVPAKLAVITNVDYDHVEVLGETLPEIAAHKAGIIKPGGLAITAERKPEALAVIRGEAAAKGARLYVLGEDFNFKISETAGEQALTVEGVNHTYRDLRVAMRGKFQLENAALAVASLDLLSGEDELELTEESVRAGLGSVRYGGRLEVMQQQPLVILDGAHNHHKALTLVESLEELYPGKKMTVVLGTLSIKDFGGIIEALHPITAKWIATQPKVFGKPSASPEQLAGAILKVDSQAEVLEADDVLGGLRAALDAAGPDEIILVTGSLYMIGDARGYWFPTEQLLYDLEKQANLT
ncbi:MAG: Mur ligase family protein [Chloroflexota bacterium]